MKLSDLTNEELLLISACTEIFEQRIENTIKRGGLVRPLNFLNSGGGITLINEFIPFNDQTIESMKNSESYQAYSSLMEKIGPIVKDIKTANPDLYEKFKLQ